MGPEKHRKSDSRDFPLKCCPSVPTTFLQHFPHNPHLSLGLLSDLYEFMSPTSTQTRILSVLLAPYDSNAVQLLCASRKDSRSSFCFTTRLVYSAHFQGKYHSFLRHRFNGMSRWAQLSRYASGRRSADICSLVAAVGV